MRQWIVLALALLSAGCASTGGGVRGENTAGVLGVVERHAAAFSNRNIGDLMQGVAPEIEWYSIEGGDVVRELSGREALRNAMLTYFAETPSMRSVIEDSAVSGAYVSVRERASWEVRGEARTQTAIGVFEVRDGLIRRVWYYPAQR